MLRIRYLTLVALLLTLTLMLVSCAPGATTTTTAGTTTQATTQATTAETTESETTQATSQDETTAESTAETTQATTMPTIDLTEEVNLIFYMAGDPQKDEATFIAELSRLSKRDFNATLEFRYLSWGDIYDRYPLILASGEVFDGTYATNWLDFFVHTQKGAFLDITDLVPTYCPDIYRIANKDSWRSVTYKNRIYGIPRSGKDDFSGDGIIYREDLRKKYNVPEIKKIEDFEAYMQAIKDNEPQMKPTGREASGLYFAGMVEKSGFAVPSYGLTYLREDPKAQLFLQSDAPEYKAMIELMVKWQGMGFWGTAEMTNQDYTNWVDKSEFGQGTSALWSTTSGHWWMAIEYFKEEHPDWEAGFYYALTPSGHVDQWDTLEDGAAVSLTSKNPERTLMAINNLLTKEEYHMVLNYGVKDVHYVLDAEGIPTYPEGVDEETASFRHGENSFSWFWYGEELFPDVRNAASDVTDKQRELASAPTLLGFYFDASDYQAEVANLSDVLTQYEVPLQWGFVSESIDADLAEMKAQMEAAGLEKVRVAMQAQADQFLADNAD